MKMYKINLFQTQRKSGHFKSWIIQAINKRNVIQALKNIGWNPRYYEIIFIQKISKVQDITQFAIKMQGKKDHLRPLTS